MKKLLLFFIATINISLSFAQNQPQTNLIVKLYPLNLIGKHVNAALEIPMFDRLSLELNGSYYFGDITKIYEEDVPIKKIEASGYAVRVGFRFYKKDKAPYGIYFSPQFMYKYILSEPRTRGFQNYWDSVIITRNIYAGKLLFGYQHQILDYFTIDIYTGVGFRRPDEVYEQLYAIRYSHELDEWREEAPIGKFNPAENFSISDAFYFSYHLGISIGFAF